MSVETENPVPVDAVVPADVALRVRDLAVTFGHRSDRLRAVDGVSFAVPRGRILGVIGESGSGKSTLVKAIAGMVPVAAGTIEIATGTEPLAPAVRSVGRDGQVQMIFQDPMLALDPGRPVWQSIVEPLAPRKFRIPRSLRADSVKLLEQVGLGAEFADRRPSQMSGGQRQRVTIARAIASRAPLVMCDEPVAALDISLQAGVLRLLDELRHELDLTYVFISHDMTSIARLADDVGVMYLGQLVEVGPAREVLKEPRHPYTQALINAIPKISTVPRDLQRGLLEGEIPDARKPPSGCRFRTRCPFAQEICAREAPPTSAAPTSVTVAGPAAAGLPTRSSVDVHATACHFWQEIRAGDAPRTGPLPD